jgi:hypothetical protein
MTYTQDQARARNSGQLENKLLLPSQSVQLGSTIFLLGE